MRLKNNLFYKLGEIDTKCAMEAKMQKCIDLGIPVLVKVPVGYKTWAMDNQLDKLTEEDVVLSEKDRIIRDI